jgi:hypothetical protein
MGRGLNPLFIRSHITFLSPSGLSSLHVDMLAESQNGLPSSAARDAMSRAASSDEAAMTKPSQTSYVG